MALSPPGQRIGTAAAVGWTTFGAIIVQAVNFVISIALTRLLVPDDFGLIAMVTAVVGFARVLADLGLSSALIQSKAPSEEQYVAVFWVNLVVGVILAVLLAGSGPMLGKFYGDPRVAIVAAVLAPQFFVTALASVHSARLQRRMAFRSLIQLELTSSLVAGTIGIAVAALGGGVWSLIARVHVQTLALAIGVCFVERWRPKGGPRRDALRKLVGFGANLTGARFLNYWIRNLDNVLIGRYFGSADVGLYTRAYSILLQPVMLITGAIGRVMFPALSAVQEDKARVRTMYRRAIEVIAFVTFPLMSLLFITADDAVRVLLGDVWSSAVPIIRIFCVCGALQSLGATAGWLFQSQGRTDLQFIWAIVAGIVLIGAMIIGINIGSVEAVALCYTIASGGILLVPAFEVPGRLIGIGFLDVVRYVAGTFACTVFAAMVATLVHTIMGDDSGSGMSIIRLLATWGVGLAAYLGCARVSGQRAYAELSNRFQQLSRRAMAK